MKDDILDYFDDETHFEKNIKVVVAKYFYFEAQAHLYAARLREVGIRSFISNANTITALPFGDGGIGLHVRQEDLEEATAIIKQLDYNNTRDNPDITYHDADQDDIEYERSVHEQMNKKIDPVYLMIIALLIAIIAWSFIRHNNQMF